MRRVQHVAALTAAILVAILSAVPETAQAGGTCNFASCTARVVEFTVMSSFIRIRLDVDATERAKVTNCTMESGIYFTLWPSHGLYKETLMTIRSAQLADREVSVRTVNGSENCAVSYVRGW